MNAVLIYLICMVLGLVMLFVVNEVRIARNGGDSWEWAKKLAARGERTKR